MKATIMISMAVALCLSSAAAAQDGAEGLGIAPQPLNKALEEFADQSGLQVIYVADLAEGKDTSGAKPNLSVTETLEQLLASTGLEYEFLNANTVTVQAVADEERSSDSGKSRATPRPVMMAQASAEMNQRTEEEQGQEGQDAASARQRERTIEEIIVTGTSIRGIAPESSPIRTYTREDIQISGVSTAQDFIQLMPQNFGGGSNSDIGLGLPNDSSSSFNDALGGGADGSSVNLRGLGSGGTLVLLNGHRLAPSSGIGDFVDISMIPASALERVEVMTDGASSIYGGDAVAGVVNFILRDDYDGAEASFRYGTVTDGDLDEYRASVTAGKNWSTGNALVVYEHFDEGTLSAKDRAFSEGATLPHDLLPSQERQSVLASASKKLTTDLEVRSDLLYTDRKSAKTVTDIGGNFLNTKSSSEYLSFSAGGAWKISETWFIDLSGMHSGLRGDMDVSGDGVIIRQIDSELWAADIKASGAVLRLSGGDLKLAIGGQYRGEAFTNFRVDQDTTDRSANRDVYAVFGEAFIPFVGPDNSVPGIERLELNVSGRFDDYSDFGSTANPKIGVLWAPVDAFKLRGSYGTSFDPPPLGRVGATDFLASAALTSRWNTIFGLTPGDPSIADVVVITVFGTDKDLDAERSKTVTAGFDFSRHWGRHDLAISTTWFDVEFENRLGSAPIPGNRIIFDAPNIAFNNPELFPEGAVVFFPSQDEVSNLLGSLDRINAIAGTDPLDAEIINRAAVVRNLSRSLVSGFDFDIAYTIDSEKGIFSLGLDGTLLVDFKQQAADKTPLVELIDTLYNPAELKLRGRTGYSYNGFSANLFVNYTNDYAVDSTAGAMPIDSWTTVDVSLSYDTQERLNNSILNNTILRLSALNLFNENPPSTPSAPAHGIFGFDPANASPLGRFIAFEFTKKFQGGF